MEHGRIFLAVHSQTEQTHLTLYDWLVLDPGTDEHLQLVHRSISKPTELAYYICHTRRPVPVAELVRVAGSR